MNTEGSTAASLPGDPSYCDASTSGLFDIHLSANDPQDNVVDVSQCCMFLDSVVCVAFSSETEEFQQPGCPAIKAGDPSPNL